MSPRLRIFAVIGVAAVVVVAAVVLVAAGGDDAQDGRSAARKGAPPLALDPGIRTDPETVALRRAVDLYSRNQRAAAAQIFDRYDSPAAQVGSAFAAWPNGTVAQLEGIAGRHPRDSLVLLNLGLARFWSGDNRGATEAWLDAYEAQPDTPSALTADRLLHPNTPQGEPVFIPSFAVPPLRSRGAAAQLAELRRTARKPDVRARLLYGIALQRIGRQRSAERAYTSAVRLAPNDPEPQVAVAVSRFTRSEPARAFSRLGPLTKRFPRAPTVRFHLGILLAWQGQVGAAEEQFRKARAIDPRDPLAREAARWLAALGKAKG
ncbi:MAG: tetratricopeptide repeat protein [Gaiellaceae bacterium]